MVEDLDDAWLKRIRLDEEYAYVKRLGAGGVASVHLIRDKKNKKQYAMKIAENVKENVDCVKKEIEFMKRLQHKNIVQYEKDSEFQNGIFVIMEYCGGGDLGKVIETHRPINAYLPEWQIVKWFQQICGALKYLHDLKILHRDLKPENIFLTDDQMVKLGDFNVSKQLLNSFDETKTQVGTPLYMSPETYNAISYNHKADMWSLGCCIYELMTFQLAINPMMVHMSRIWSIKELPRNYSEALCSIVREMLMIEPNQRPSVADILNCPFMQEPREKEVLPRSGEETVVMETGTPAEIEPMETRTSTESTAMQMTPVEGVDFAETEMVEPHTSLETSPVDAGTCDEAAKVASPASNSVQNASQCEKAANTVASELLGAFGYKFNEKNQLVDLINGEKFKFDICENKEQNQEHYLNLAEAVSNHVADLLEKDLNLNQVLIPGKIALNEPFTFIYATPDFINNKDKLLILVSGLGPIRPGVWSRKAIINDSIEAGSQIPAIRRAVVEGYSVLVLNQNYSYFLVDGVPCSFDVENSGSSNHLLNIWNDIVIKCTDARRVAFLAHTGGGSAVVRLAVECEEHFKHLVFGVAFFHSNHDSELSAAPKTVVDFFHSNSRNWIASKKPLNKNLGKGKFSAGDERPEWAASSATDVAFKYLNEKYQERFP